MEEPLSPKSRFVALVLCFLFGWIGVHRFYVGKVGTGILMILTLSFCGIWTFIDLIMIAIGCFRDKKRRLLFRWFEEGSI